MPFGLCNALVTFQKLVTKAFKEYLNKFMRVFLDDFSVYGSKKDHFDQLQKCLEYCKQNGISQHPKKCAFYVNLGVILGHIVCSDGLLVHPKKLLQSL
jgi:hypothetical protein